MNRLIHVFAATVAFSFLAGCSPATHVHATLDEGLGPGELEPALHECMAHQGFRLTRRLSPGSERIETWWFNDDHVEVEAIFHAGGGWLDVIGFTGASKREAIATGASVCLEKATLGLRMEMQTHGRVVWRP
ncbi:MAG: hypothetical protein R3200_11485 [Xanthomonadales bacterium]|nr:hypothetical protein [Xanthomonadales bacterium]